jgi:hypothetical protein
MSSVLADPVRPERSVPIYTVRWPAIFAGVAVGLSAHLLLMLIGIAAGLTAADNVASDAGRPDPRNAAMIAAAWNGVSMLIAAFIGGYVAARASGLRRTGDGVLHGVVAWAATTILTAILATTLFSAAMSGLFGVLRGAAQIGADAAREAPQGASAAAEVTQLVQQGRRDEAIAMLQQRFNLPPDQARGVVDSLGTANGSAQGAANDPQRRAQLRQTAAQTAERAGQATWWLIGAILLALVLGMIGGSIGTRAAARRIDSNKIRSRRIAAGAVAPPGEPGLRTERVVVR